MIAVALLASIMLFLAAAGIWQTHLNELRWVVTVCVAAMCVAARRDSWLWVGILLAILIVFNPFHPLRFPRGAMRLVELTAATCLLMRGLARV